MTPWYQHVPIVFLILPCFWREFCYCIKKSDLWKLISVSTVPHLTPPILSMSYRSTPPARLVSRSTHRKPSRYTSPYTSSENSQPIYQLGGYWHVDFTHIPTHKMAPLSLNSYWHLYRIDELHTSSGKQQIWWLRYSWSYHPLTWHATPLSFCDINSGTTFPDSRAFQLFHLAHSPLPLLNSQGGSPFHPFGQSSLFPWLVLFIGPVLITYFLLLDTCLLSPLK